MSSKTESSYETVKNGDSYKSKYSKTAISNGSINTKSELYDGKPLFTTTLEGQNIERKYVHHIFLEHFTPYRNRNTISACTYAFSQLTDTIH